LIDGRWRKQKQQNKQEITMTQLEKELTWPGCAQRALVEDFTGRQRAETTGVCRSPLQKTKGRLT
jgi:hypothetical protein